MRMKMFNVQPKEVSLVYCTNQTKKVRPNEENIKKKTSEQSRVRKGSPKEGVGSMVGRLSGKYYTF